MPSRKPPSRRAIHAAIVLLSLIWGSTWVVIKQGLEDLPALTSAAVRFTVAGTVLLVLAPLLHRFEGGERPAPKLWLMVGVLVFGLSYAMVYWGETVIPSGLVAVLFALFPMVSAVLGHFVLPGEQLRPAQVLGFLLGFAGVGVLFAVDLRHIGPEALALGALVLLSPIVCAVSQVVVKRDGATTSAVLLNRNAMLVGAALLWCAALLLEVPSDAVWTGQAIWSVAYLSLVGTVVTFVLYYWVLRWARSNDVSLIAYVTAPIALVLGWAFGGETLTVSALAGTATIALGIFLAARGQSRSEPDSAARASSS